MQKSRRNALALMWMAAAASCTNSMDEPVTHTDMNAASNCPNVAGTWTVKTHCTSSLVGAQVTVAQNACVITLSGALDALNGAVGADGSFVARGGRSICSGVGDAKMITATCDTSCGVTLRH